MKISTTVLVISGIALVACLAVIFLATQSTGEHQVPSGNVQTYPTPKETPQNANQSVQETQKSIQETTETQMDLTQFYTGFKSLEPGDYVIWKMSSGDQRVLYLGTEKINNRTCDVIEFVIETNGSEQIVRLWIDKNTRQNIKVAIKIDNTTYCTSQLPMQEESNTTYTSTPEEYKPENIVNNYKYSIVDFTTETGKTIKAVKIEQNNSEVWLSSEIPFGTVKEVVNGITYIELKDFGNNGTPKITEEDLNNCVPLEQMMFQ